MEDVGGGRVGRVVVGGLELEHKNSNTIYNYTLILS